LHLFYLSAVGWAQLPNNQIAAVSHAKEEMGFEAQYSLEAGLKGYFKSMFNELPLKKRDDRTDTKENSWNATLKMVHVILAGPGFFSPTSEKCM